MNEPIARPCPTVYNAAGVFVSTVTIATAAASAPDARNDAWIAVATPGARKNRSTITCHSKPAARIAMNSAPARASNPSSAATAAAAGNVARGSTVGDGSPRVVASMTAKYTPMAQATASRSRAIGLGNSETPGTPARVRVMNAGKSGIAKNAVPRIAGTSRCSRSTTDVFRTARKRPPLFVGAHEGER